MSDKIRDDESCFGFHSEYYVYYTRMREKCYGNEGWNGEAEACRGYIVVRQIRCTSSMQIRCA